MLPSDVVIRYLHWPHIEVYFQLAIGIPIGFFIIWESGRIMEERGLCENVVNYRQHLMLFSSLLHLIRIASINSQQLQSMNDVDMLAMSM